MGSAVGLHARPSLVRVTDERVGRWDDGSTTAGQSERGQVAVLVALALPLLMLLASYPLGLGMVAFTRAELQTAADAAALAGAQEVTPLLAVAQAKLYLELNGADGQVLVGGEGVWVEATRTIPGPFGPIPVTAVASAKMGVAGPVLTR